jgi:DNA polymerase III subunit epsilon
MYAIVDIETTGGYAAASGITEIAILIHDGTRVVKRFETLINPQQNIPRYITALTGIDNYMVQDAPVFEEIASVLYELLHDQVFVAHNVNFDYSFVKHHLKNAGFELNVKKLCTVRLGRKVFPGLPSYSLGNLCRSLNINIENRHRAGGDANATAILFDHILANDGEKQIDLMLKRSSSEQWLPLHLEKKSIQQLPVTPGVYYFHNEKDKIVYVGKAINIRKRVSSHFTVNDAGRKRQNFVRTIHKITYKECANELEAIILENIEIRRLWPRYNQSLKKPIQRFGLYMYEDNYGYQRLAIDKKKKNLQSLYTFNLLNEGIVMLRKMIEEFELNEKLCFLDKNSFKKEDREQAGEPDVYNVKVKAAMEALNDQLPTFAVVDDGSSEEEKLCLLIERGSFWGMGRLPASIKISSSEELKTFLNPYSDDDHIRNTIYSYIETYPHTKVSFA